MTIKRQLKKRAKKAKPNKQFKKVLYVELHEAYEARHPFCRAPWYRAAAVPIAICVIVFTMGTGSYAYASPEVNEQHMLYPVKSGIESVEGMFHRSSESRAQYHARMIERRLAEAERLMDDEAIPVKTVDAYQEEMTFTLVHVQEMPEGDLVRVQMIDRLQAHQLRYHYLMEYFNNLSEDEQEEVVEQISNALEETRVLISETELSEEEKAALMRYLQDQPSRLESSFMRQAQPGQFPRVKGELVH